MIKKIFFIFGMITTLPLFSQDKAALTKGETINYINKKLLETQNLQFNYNFDVKYRKGYNFTQQFNRMYITSNYFELNSSGTIKHVDVLATSLSNCYSLIPKSKDNTNLRYGNVQSVINFNPIYITNVEIIANNDDKIGIIRIKFLANTEKWERNKYEYLMYEIKAEKYIHYYDNNNRPVYDDINNVYYGCYTFNSDYTPSGSLDVFFLKSDPDNGKKLIKAFNHLIALYKAEDDPFGN